MAKTSADRPFYIRQKGLEYGPGRGGIIGFDEQQQADDCCAEKNQRAEEMGLEARYEVIAN